jgi:DNA-binding transcriptional ArsR family regulator
MKASNYFAVVPQWIILNTDLSDGAVRLYALLRRYADKSGEAWPRVTRLADQLEKGQRTIQRHLQELEAAGALRIKAYHHDDGRQGANRYIVVSENPSLLAWGGVEDDTDDHATGDTHKESHRNESQQGNRAKLFDAMMKAWLNQTDHSKLTKSERGRINAAISELDRIGATPDEIIDRADAYRRRMPSATISPQAIARNWNAIAPTTLKHNHVWAIIDDRADGVLYRCKCGLESLVPAAGEGAR